MYYIFESDGSFAYSVNAPPVSDETREIVLDNREVDFKTQKPKLVNGAIVFEDYIQTAPPEITE
jgi:hypothetical protein